MKSNKKIIGEIITFVRFFIVGAAATLIHISVATLSISQFDLPVFRANLLAFLVAFMFAFSGHFIWTFRSQSHLARSLFRYFTISISAFALNNLVLLTLVNTGVLSDIVSVILAAAVIPLISFTASRLWGFRS